jgi:cytochrome c peroxidase
LIQANRLTGDPAAGLELPSIDDPVAVLGRKLFFSKSLGGDRDSACVSCHHPMLGGGDGLAQSIGVGAEEQDLLGPGRSHPDGDLTVPRNAPTTFNLALWQKGLFWDSRVENLEGGGTRTPDSDFGTPDPDAGASISEAQSRFPVTSAEEMRGFDFVLDGSNAEVRTALEQRLVEDGNWVEEFAAAFDSSEISYGRIAEAIAAYEDSQVFTRTPWRAYVEGNLEAIGDSAKRGALLFFRTTEDGGADCASCHASDFFTDEDFHSICAPQIGRGKGDGFLGSNDHGRARENDDRNYRFSFRTPTLLNVSATGPYLHSGAYDELADVVRHHLDPRAAIERFDPSSVPLAASDVPRSLRQTDRVLSSAVHAYRPGGRRPGGLSGEPHRSLRARSRVSRPVDRGVARRRRQRRPPGRSGSRRKPFVTWSTPNRALIGRASPKKSNGFSNLTGFDESRTSCLTDPRSALTSASLCGGLRAFRRSIIEN